MVQSSLFDRYRRRMVVPLVRRTALPGQAATVGSRMNPVFQVNGTEVVLRPLDMVSVALDQFGEQVASLAEHGQAISDALDELLIYLRLSRAVSRFLSKNQKTDIGG